MADNGVYMLNALWFKANGGEETFARYFEGALPAIHRVGGEVVSNLRTAETLQGDFDPDLTFITRWPSMEAFRALIADPEYQAIAHLRGESIEKAMLTRCEAVEPS